jgi:transposase-like protein
MNLCEYRKIASDELRCWRLFERLRFPGGVACPSCGCRRCSLYVKGAKRRWKCLACPRDFCALTGTPLSGTKLPLSKRVFAVGLFKVGISANALSSELSVTYKVAWNMLRVIRSVLPQDETLGLLEGEIEIDESYDGGRRKGKRGRGAAGKKIVVGLKERGGGRVRTVHVPSAKTDVLRRVIAECTDPRGRRLLADKSAMAVKLKGEGVVSDLIDHGEAYAVGDVHTQGIEGYWGHRKPKMTATYRKTSPKYHQSYLDEHAFKTNLPKSEDFMLTVLKKLASSFYVAG